MTESRGRIPYVAYDADGRIDQDLPCLKCGYNLRSLSDEGACPECGAGLEMSARLAWLCQHDPRWLRRLVRATVWIGVAMVCFALYLSLYLLIWTFRWPLPVEVGYFVRAAIISGAITGLLGFWVVTTPHRGTSTRERRGRRIARWTMAAGLGALLLGLALGQLRQPLGLLSLYFPSSTLCLGVAAWATLNYAAALAAKVPAPRLIKLVRFGAWGFALCFAAYAVSGLMGVAARLAAASMGMRTTTYRIAFVTFSLLLLLSVFTFPLLFWYRRRFREARALSEQTARGSPRLESPECEHDTPQRRSLYRNHRLWIRVAFGVILLLLLSYPLIVIDGWYREQQIVEWLQVRGRSATAPTHTEPDWLAGRLTPSYARFFERLTYATVRSDDGLAWCAKLRHLEVVDASGREVTDAGLVHLEKLPHFRWIELVDTSVTDAGVTRLKQALPKVRIERRDTWTGF